MSHWVGHLDLKELYINDLIKRKQMIDDMEAELTEAPKKIKYRKFGGT